MPSMEYGYLFTDGNYVVTYKIFIVTAQYFKKDKDNSASWNFYFDKQCSCPITSTYLTINWQQ